MSQHFYSLVLKTVTKKQYSLSMLLGSSVPVKFAYTLQFICKPKIYARGVCSRLETRTGQ